MGAISVDWLGPHENKLTGMGLWVMDLPLMYILHRPVADLMTEKLLSKTSRKVACVARESMLEKLLSCKTFGARC